MTFLSVLTLIFVTLKLTGYIAWSWWLIFTPLYVLLFLFFVLAYGTYKLGETMVFRSRKHRRPF